MVTPKCSLSFRIRVGLIVITYSCCAFIGLGSEAMGQGSPNREKPASSATLKTSGFELSGLTAVDGGFLVADDELIGAVLFLPASAGQQKAAEIVKIERKRKESQPFTQAPRLMAVQDFEGIASEDGKNIFFIGSHNGKDGDRRPDREFLIEARWDLADQELQLVKETRDLVTKLDGALKKLGVSLNLSETKIDERLNIEGLACSQGKIYIGLRGPLNKDKAAIIFRADATSLFGDSKKVAFDVFEISLRGAGVRSLEWDPVSKKMLVLSGPATDTIDAESGLWAFEPQTKALELIHTFTPDELKPGGKDRTAEGVCRMPNGKIMVAFDGSAEGAPNLLLFDWP